MKLLQNLFDLFCDKAGRVEISLVSIGLGYTVVTTADGGIGLSYTYFDRKISCSMVPDNRNYEGYLASELLPKILSPHPIDRSVGLALINALNHSNCRDHPADPGNRTFFSALGVGPGVKLGMVGAVPPMIKMIEEIGASVEVFDEFKSVGGPASDFTSTPDAVILTSTSILNNTTEQLLSGMDSHVKVALLGPSTPMCFEPFDHLPICVLAGLSILDSESIIKGVRHGAGTRVLQSFCRKTVLVR